MQFRQLEYFLAVAKEEHFARAAEACYVSQPALSVAIAKLERELNVTLINRGHNYQGLTAEGERMAVWAKRILAEQEAFKDELAALRSGITGTLRLGSEPTASTTLVLPVAAFCAAHPQARVQVHSRLSTTELSRLLREFELDAAIAHFAAADLEGLQVTRLYTERYLLLVSEQLLPGTEPVTWADAARLPLALLGPTMRIRQVIDRAFDESGVAVAPHLETDSVASLCSMVAAGASATILPHSWLQAMPAGVGTHAVPLIEPTTRVEVSVAVNAADPGSLTGRAFLNAASRLGLGEFFDETLPLEYHGS